MVPSFKDSFGAILFVLEKRYYMEIKPRIGVGILIIKDGKILLGYRSPSKIQGVGELHEQGTWCAPGGKVDFGETLIESARRELKEETDLDCEKLKILNIQDNIEEKSHYVTVAFLGEEVFGEIKVMEPEKQEKWEWFDVNHLPQNMYSPTKKAIELYLNNKVYEEDKVEKF